jgi:hypothetical protein
MYESYEYTNRHCDYLYIRFIRKFVALKLFIASRTASAP